MAFFDIDYTTAGKINAGIICAFCRDRFKYEGEPSDGIYAEEVGEFWSDKLERSVLAHPDCTPRGIDLIVQGKDPDWKLA